MPKVRYERRGAASVLTIERPERRNAVDTETAALLLEGYRQFEADDEARVLVLTGEGPEAFCAGADLKAIAETGPMATEEAIDGGTQRLPRIVGMGRALDLILTGRIMHAEEAHDWGLLNEVVPQGKHLER